MITSAEHALATAAASHTVKVAKFVETAVLAVFKTVKADKSTIEAVTSLITQAANIQRAGFAVLGVIINAPDTGAAAGPGRAVGQSVWQNTP